MNSMEQILETFTSDPSLQNMLTSIDCHGLTFRENGESSIETALLDMDEDGEPDTVALNISGNETYELYIVDTDSDGVPDAAYLDRESLGVLSQLPEGDPATDTLTEAAAKLFLQTRDSCCAPASIRAQLSALRKSAEALQGEMIYESVAP